MTSQVSFSKNKYPNQSETAIKHLVEEMGFKPLPITNSPKYKYEGHAHPGTKLLVIMQGSMQVEVGTASYHCEKGDELIIPCGVHHSAVVGFKGCKFLWSEKIISND